MSKKNIDELFREKFLDFKESPDEKVWSSIEASLNKRRKKRVLPIWWQLGGIAAILVIGLFLFNPFDVNTTPGNNPVTDVERKDNGASSRESITNSEEVQSVPDDTGIANEEVRPVDANNNEQLVESEKNKEAISPSMDKAKDLIQKSNFSKDPKTTKAVASQDHDIDATDSQIETPSAVIKGENKENSEVALTVRPNENVDNKKDTLTRDYGKAIADNEEEKSKNIEKTDSKKSLFDELKNQENEKTAIAEKSEKRWSAGPSIAPVYYDAVGKGSPLSPMFRSNSKSGNVNLSYGVSVAYEISPKLSVRSGVHKVEYGYNTNNVSFTSSLSALGQDRIANIDYAENTDNLVVAANNSTLSSTSKSFDVSAKTVSRSGVMAQQLGYLEVPVELSYALVNNKFGVNLIGGVSSLFLVDNEVDLTSGNLTTQIGEANNVNDLNFSANFGIGLGYQFTKKLRFNLEPVFKYQLNTFSNVDGNFNPYAVGVYSGLNFKF